MPNFKKELKKAKHFYFHIWRGNEKPCPAFSGEVVKVTREGWNHIRFGIRRYRSEVLRRLSLLAAAKYILETEYKIKHYRKQGKIEYWSLEAIVNKKLIRVIVRSVNPGHKYFFSVFVRKFIN